MSKARRGPMPAGKWELKWEIKEEEGPHSCENQGGGKHKAEKGGKRIKAGFTTAGCEVKISARKERHDSMEKQENRREEKKRKV